MTQSSDYERLQDLKADFSTKAPSPIASLAQLWAKKYVQRLQDGDESTLSSEAVTRNISQVDRQQTVDRLNQSLRFTSAQAWSKTEALLASEVQRHHIDPDLIDPWQIAHDSHHLFETAFKVYAEQSSASSTDYSGDRNDFPTPVKLSVVIAPEVGKVRHKYTGHDPRVLGFVSMQFHYSGQLLLDLLSPLERITITSYLKVIDDHLYMPLQRSYEAAATHDYNSPALVAVRQLLPTSSEIARKICDRVAQMYPSYRSYSGTLSTPALKVSTIRDVEMFQVYLCLCVLEGSIKPLQQELFPLCVMLYPPLHVSWTLIRNMLRLLGQELAECLDDKAMSMFRPYVRAMWDMFSVEVLPDSQFIEA